MKPSKIVYQFIMLTFTIIKKIQSATKDNGHSVD